MDHKADVGLVDTHSESDGRNNDGYFVADKPFLGLPAEIIIKSGMVRQCFETVCGQVRGQPFGVLSREAIYDGGFVFMSVQKLD